MTLHCHTDRSTLDGYGSSEAHIHALTELEVPMEGLAITDHGTTAGWYAHEKVARKHSINPIFGIETYWVPDIHIHDKNSNFGTSPAHLILLAKSGKGLRNINAISTKAYAPEGFYQKPRCDTKHVLVEHSEGVIATSACLGGPVGKFIHMKDHAAAFNWVNEMGRVFGEDFYLELQPHDMDDQRKLNRFLYEHFKDKFKFIVTCDSHYPKPGDKLVRKISFLTSMHKTLADKLPGDYEISLQMDYHLRDYQTLYEELCNNNPALPNSFCEEAMRTTVDLLRTVKVDLPKGLSLMPGWTGEGTPQSALGNLLSEGLNQKFKGERIPTSRLDEYKKRLRYEYNLVCNKGFAEYFLVVQDMVQAAKDLGMMVGVGRGSAGGSLVAYFLGITEVDPVKWDLPLERFISPERGGYDMTFHSPSEITEMTNLYLERIMS